MTITTITISAINYVAYASVAEADARLAVDPVRAATWTALTTEQKGINLVAATNQMDLLDWAGEKTGGASQENAWARTGVLYPDGSAVSTSEVPVALQNGTILLAGTIAIKPTASNQTSSASNIKKVGAGSAAVEFFRPTTGKALSDDVAFKMIQMFLASAVSSSTGNMVSGEDECSSFTDSGYPDLVQSFP